MLKSVTQQLHWGWLALAVFALSILDGLLTVALVSGAAGTPVPLWSPGPYAMLLVKALLAPAYWWMGTRAQASDPLAKVGILTALGWYAALVLTTAGQLVVML